MSAAQRALAIDELLRHILGYVQTRALLDPESAIRWANDPPPSFLLTAAHVNKQWCDAALDCLWADISWRDIEGILSWRDPSPQSSNPAEINTTPLLVRHAHRIRELDLALRFSDEERDALSRIPAKIWTDMGMLRTLLISTDWSPKQFEAYRRFLSPALSTICFSVSLCNARLADKAHWWSAEHEAFFNDLRRASSSMRVFYLELDRPKIWPFLEDHILSLLEGMHNLKAVYVPTFALSPTFITCCAAGHPGINIRSSVDRNSTGMRLPQPWHLAAFYNSPMWKVAEGQLTKAPPILDELDGFGASDRCSLSELAVCTDTAGLCRLVQYNLDVKRLTQIEIALVRAPTIDGLRHTLRVVGREAAVREFRLTAPDSAGWSPKPGFGEPNLARLEWHTLAPLMACTTLEVFVVAWETSVAITEADIEEFARAWPQLRTLHLWAGRPHPSNPLEPMPSMAVLATLSRHCPLLQRVKMQLSPITPLQVPGVFRAFEHLTEVEITVGVPAADDTPCMAATHAFLRAILPPKSYEDWSAGPYRMWRIALSDEDPAAMGLHNASEWGDWMRDITLYGSELYDLWQEESDIA